LKSGSYDGLHGIRGVVSPLFFEERCGKYWWPQKKRGIGELLEQEKSIVVPQYDSFMGIGGGIGDVLELL
jgi:hypothetical protein